MANWLVRADAPSINFDGNFEKFSITARRKPRIANGDTIVFLKSAEGAFYEGFAKVTAVLPRENADDGKGKTTTAFAISRIKGSAEAADIDTLKFSLTFVRNISNPRLHFRRGYRALLAPDLKTIENGEAFLARTGYYELLGSLPTSLRASFDAEEIVMAAAARQFANDFKSRLKRLFDFIETRILSVGKQLVAIDKALNSLGLNAEFEHYLAEEGDIQTTSRTDLLSVQVERFRSLNEVLNAQLIENEKPGDLNVIQQLLLELDQEGRANSERRFERVFGRVA